MDLEAVRTGPLHDHADPAPIVEGSTVWSGRVFDVSRERVAFHGGEMVREFTTHFGAVGILAIDADERVLLINQYRQPIRTRDWEIPAGLLDVEGEDPLAAAQRELAEEADLVAADWGPPLTFYPSPGQSDETVTLFEARQLSPAPDVHDRTDEEAEIVLRWVSLDDAVAAVLDGRVKNALVAIAVLRAHARRG